MDTNPFDDTIPLGHPSSFDDTHLRLHQRIAFTFDHINLR